ncbi:hypothetical protein NKH18_45465 [Streptomyces sp. M10(2022)]
MTVVVALTRWMGVGVSVVVGGGQTGRDTVVAVLAPPAPGIGHALGEDPGQRGRREQRTGVLDLRTRYLGASGRANAAGSSTTRSAPSSRQRRTPRQDRDHRR